MMTILVITESVKLRNIIGIITRISNGKNDFFKQITLSVYSIFNRLIILKE